MIEQASEVVSAPGCHRNRRLARAVELSVRGTELLGASNALLRQIAEISQHTLSSNYHAAQVLLGRSSRAASQEAAMRIARHATRSALEIGVLVDGVAPAWRRGIAAPAPHVTNLSDLSLRLMAIAMQVERLARLPLTLQRERHERHELAALARSMQGMREIAQRNIQVAQRSAASVERMQHEALRFVRKLAQA